jgi:hypothetical protein
MLGSSSASKMTLLGMGGGASSLSNSSLLLPDIEVNPSPLPQPVQEAL